ncbi:Holliday junction DNA helicase RuvB [Symmachiella dynata]|nr:MoxR family ATPase [Symmachiella dynata]QDT49057.1 Holliday junction DNA helicase RuvB [Symmachiella dynata]
MTKLETMNSKNQEVQSTEGHCQYQSTIDGLRLSLNEALIGKSDIVELVLACVLSRGHILFDDLPGLGKTTLAKAVARVIGGRFARVQCTPDLLPGDITGFNIFNQKSRGFEFREGPIFSDVLLADEINRATPRTQSALFEAMAERQVTIDNQTYPLSESFIVIATQNPVESHGAFPLPEAQLDRFSMKLRIGYPDPSSELSMLAANVGPQEQNPTASKAIIDPAQLQLLQQHVAGVGVDVNVQRYLVDLATATRNHRDITLGLSPRGLLTWQRAAQAWAHLQRRDFVVPDDIQHVAGPILEVRLAVDIDSGPKIVKEILDSVPVPVLN